MRRQRWIWFDGAEKPMVTVAGKNRKFKKMSPYTFFQRISRNGARRAKNAKDAATLPRSASVIRDTRGSRNKKPSPHAEYLRKTVQEKGFAITSAAHQSMRFRII